MLLSVKQATADDAPMLAALGGKTFYDTFRPYNTEEDIRAYIAKAYDQSVIAENLQKKNIRYAICYHNGQPVGYTKLIGEAGYEGLAGQAIELEKIYVLKEVLGSGAGKMLMGDAIGYSAEAGFDVLFLGVWEENGRAIRFYEKNGFYSFATRKFQLGQRICNDFMMKLELKK